jgi:hypothetical protein
MLKNLFALSLVAVHIATLADVPQSDYMRYSDQLIQQYHLLRKDALPDSKSLAFELRNARPPLQQLAGQFLSENDAFKKRDLEASLVAAMQSQLQVEPTRFLSIPYTLFLEPYDFKAKQFGVCFDDKCLGPKLHPVYFKPGTLKYELSVQDTPNRIFFSPSEEIARRLEAVAGKQGRHILAMLVIETTGTRVGKWSDDSPYRVLQGQLAGIHFLSVGGGNPAKLVAPESIIYSIAKQ